MRTFSHRLAPHQKTLLFAQQVKQLEQAHCRAVNLPSYHLMEAAGAAAAEVLKKHWPHVEKIMVLVGGGNNGGDGLEVARHAVQLGCDVTLVWVGSRDKLSGDAKIALERLQGLHLRETTAERADFSQADLFVDALLGTGLSGEVRGDYADVIKQVNLTATPVLALDVPSGLDADSGRILGCAIKARRTVTFIRVKPGLVTAQGPDLSGLVTLADLGVVNVPAECDLATTVENHPPANLSLWRADWPPKFSPRSRTSHKGDFGHLLIVGGEHGMAGAPRMAAESAQRAGVGLCSVVTRTAHSAAMAAQCPEVMWQNDSKLTALFDKASALVIGPGLGLNDWGEGHWQTLVSQLRSGEFGKSLVVDADALNLLARSPFRCDHWILTPHPGEAARLLNCSVAEVEADRLQSVKRIQQQYGGVVVLKGAGSLIAQGERVTLVPVANAGMASGGMGDLLSGIIGSLLAQGWSLIDAAVGGVCLHGEAAERAVIGPEGRRMERGMRATDLLPHIHFLVNPTDTE